MNERYSERWLIFQRIITFLDEWLFYGLLVYLFVNEHWIVMVPVTVIGAAIIWNSYRRQWAMETRHFGALFDDSPDP